ncbi:MAG: exonuclease SbcCD subunit D [Bacillota bacterium]|nr:exonuclease SbcCD subunit D [Bacillota bacterium]
MKLVHLSDLHLGKQVNEFPMIEEQKYILAEIIRIIDESRADAVIVAGDIYDKSVPAVEAVRLLGDFLQELAARKLPVFIISGNHDSAERLAFASSLIDMSGIHISPVYDGQVSSFSLEDEYGIVDIHLLPFIKPVHVRRAFQDEKINSYNDALKVAIEHMDINMEHRNVLVTHQFVTGASRSDSEEKTVGGTDNVDAAAFESFDYVALGHIHRPQNIGERIRYCGTPLKYSFSEANHNKSVTIVELGEGAGGECSLTLSTEELVPEHDMVELRGTYEQLMDRNTYEGTSLESDYVHITLTDEEDVINAMGRLQSVYRNIMKLDYDNIRTRTESTVRAAQDLKKKKPANLFAELYEMQNGVPMSEEQSVLLDKLVKSIWEGEE